MNIFRKLNQTLHYHSRQKTSSYQLLCAYFDTFHTVFPELRLSIISEKSGQILQYSENSLDRPKKITRPSFMNKLNIIASSRVSEDRKSEQSLELQALYPETHFTTAFPAHCLSGDKRWFVIEHPWEITPRKANRIHRHFVRVSYQMSVTKIHAVQKSAEKFKAQEQSVAALAHQLKSPLATIKSLLQAFPTFEGKHSQHIHHCLHRIDQTESMIHHYLEFIRYQQFSLYPITLSHIIHQTKTTIMGTHSSQIKIEWPIHCASEDFQILGNLFYSAQALICLLQNSLKAVATSGRIECKVENNPDDLQLHIYDTGPGVPQHMVKHLFQPFKSGFDSGHGLGLNICQKIMALHGGAVGFTPKSQHTSANFFLQFQKPCKAQE